MSGRRLTFRVSHNLRGERPDHLEVTADLAGDLAGWQVVVPFVLDSDHGLGIDGPVMLSPPQGGAWLDDLSARAARSLQLDFVRRQVVAHLQLGAGWFGLEGIEWARGTSARAGRRGRPDSWYLLWAERKAEADRATGGKASIKYLRDKYGASEGSINASLTHARDRKLLKRTAAGTEVLTAKAERLRQRQSEEA